MGKVVNKLPDKVAEKYKVQPGKPYKFAYGRFGLVDLNHATVGLVESLIKAGIKHIVPVVPKKKEKEH